VQLSHFSRECSAARRSPWRSRSAIVCIAVLRWGCCATALVVAVDLALAQVPTTPPPDVRQQGERLERVHREREEAQRSLCRPAPQAPPPPISEATKSWSALESPWLPIREVGLVGVSSASCASSQWVQDDPMAGSDPPIGRCLGVAGGQRPSRASAAGLNGARLCDFSHRVRSETLVHSAADPDFDPRARAGHPL